MCGRAGMYFSALFFFCFPLIPYLCGNINNSKTSIMINKRNAVLCCSCNYSEDNRYFKLYGRDESMNSFYNKNLWKD